MDNNFTKEEEKKLTFNYNAVLVSITSILHNNIKNLNFYLENPDSNSNTDSNNKLQQEEMDFERNDRLKYSILNDISEIVELLNKSDFLPEYHLTLSKLPKIRKENQEKSLLR
jgi:hypothetical protein